MKKYTKLFFTILIYCILNIILYALFLFATLEPNPILWDSEYRLIYAIIDLILIITITYPLISDDK